MTENSSKANETLNDMVKGVIFDVDGVLLDSMKIWNNAGERYLKKQGITPEPHLGDIMFSMTLSEGAQYLIDKYHVSAPIEDVKKGIMAEVEHFYFEEAKMKDGARELLDRLKKAGVRMSVATSTDRYCIEGAFSHLGIMDYFDIILTCSEVGKSKENPDIFFEAVSVMKTPIEYTWLFEDGLYSMKTAKREGFRVVGVYDSVSEKDQEEIRRVADVYLTSLDDFKLV